MAQAPEAGRAARLRAIRLLHTLVWAFFAGAILALPVCVFLGHTGLAWALAALVMLEVLVLAANGMRCPLTAVAARYTDERQDNFDIYLPLWLARYNKHVFGTLYAAGLLYALIATAPPVVLRIVALCVVLAGAETLHGIFRAAVLVPRLGKARALRVAVVTGSLLAFVACWLLVPGTGIGGTLPLLGLGVVLALFMAGFDIALGLFLLKKPWRRVREDFDPRTGNYLLAGVLLLATFPLAVSWLQG